MQAAAYSTSKLAADRPVQWAFIGTIQGHKERVGAINTFYNWQPHIIDAGLTAKQMVAQYNTSKFVLIGRGYTNLDCYRIYEAIIAGAIPM